MFFNCNALTTLILTNFNTSKVTNMDSMFRACKALVTLDLSSFNTSKVTAFLNMFKDCISLTTITGSIDCSNATSGLYSSATTSIFANCTSLQSVSLVNIYANCAMTNDVKWSIDLSKTKLLDSSLVNIINNIPNLSTKGVKSNTKIKLMLPTSNTLNAEQIKVATDKGWIVTGTH